MFDLAELREGILGDFAEAQAMVCQVDDVWAEQRASKWREYQREWVRAKRATMKNDLASWRAYQREWVKAKRLREAKPRPTKCACCGAPLTTSTRRPRIYCGPACRQKNHRTSVIESVVSIQIAGE